MKAERANTQRRAFTVATLAAEWECSEGAIRKLIVAGQLRVFRIGALIRIPADEVERFECQNIASNDSSGDMQSSGETQTESDTGIGWTPPTALERRLRRGEGGGAKILDGRWGKS